MTTFILSTLFMLIIILLMCIGIIFSNKPLTGSCGNSCECTFKDKVKCALTSKNN